MSDSFGAADMFPPAASAPVSPSSSSPNSMFWTEYFFFASNPLAPFPMFLAFRQCGSLLKAFPEVLLLLVELPLYFP